MRFFEAFQQTQLRYKLRAADIARKAGIAPANLSQFRNGRNIRTDTLERILAAIPPEAREYLLSLVADDPAAGLEPLDEEPATDEENA